MIDALGFLLAAAVMARGYVRLRVVEMAVMSAVMVFCAAIILAMGAKP